MAQLHWPQRMISFPTFASRTGPRSTCSGRPISAHDELEAKVKVHTQQLADANVTLVVENDERRRACSARRWLIQQLVSLITDGRVRDSGRRPI
jgi:hypothetical protein